MIYNLYGSTEIAVAAVATPGELRSAPGTVGRSPRGCVVRLYDGDGQRVTGAERRGRLFVGSELAFAGYTGGGHKEVIDGLLSSGDVGHFDADGLLFVDGRDDDMIVSGGENVFPVEIENLLTSRDDIADAAVIGVDDPDFGQRLKAFVVVVPGASPDADELRAYVRANLARYKVPKEIVFTDELPRNPTGKVVKAELFKPNIVACPVTMPVAFRCQVGASQAEEAQVPLLCVGRRQRREVSAWGRNYPVRVTGHTTSVRRAPGHSPCAPRRSGRGCCAAAPG